MKKYQPESIDKDDTENHRINTNGFFSIKKPEIRAKIVYIPSIRKINDGTYLSDYDCINVEYDSVNCKQLEINRLKYEADVWSEEKHNTKRYESHIIAHSTSDDFFQRPEI